ncbi:MAG: calcium/sodium antiporter, partial [Phascolarctobacterium sp.]|nr:calcium/sodium antiporter [Phascolarctobacterium sp.]
MDLLLQFALLALGFVLLGKGADWFVEGAAGIAAKFGIPQLVIGLTIVAMGTSAPEAAVSIAASIKGSADITIGNVVGSNILNILVILGCASVITPLLLARSTARIEIPYVIAVTALLFWQGRDGVISFTDGLVLCVGFVIYLVYLYRMAVNSAPPEEEPGEEMSLGKCVVWTLGGLAVIIAGSNVTVNAATAIAVFMGLSERIIGLTIVALGTSLPELFTSVTAARKGNADIAIGNIVGSNIFNILFVVALSALIVDIPFAKAFT